jgi:hypothetical protein
MQPKCNPYFLLFFLWVDMLFIDCFSSLFGPVFLFFFIFNTVNADIFFSFFS